MIPEWKEFLVSKGATFKSQTKGDQLISFADSETSTPAQTTTLCDLSDRALIKVSGEDAESFLQNQLSNDIRNVNESTHQASAWCSPKGRIIVTFRIFKRDDSFCLIVSADLLELILKKLRMYVMMSKVEIEDTTDSLVHFGFAGDNAEKLIINCCEQAPNDVNQTTNYQSLSILRLPGTVARFEIVGDLEDAKQLWEHAQQQSGDDVTSTTSQHWNYLNILAGLPVITEDSSEAWIPQMVNYIAIGGVDFKKGCYPGQEIVARLNYLGKTKRRMYHLLIDTDTLPAINDSIASESDKTAGKILNVVINPDGKAEALAVLKISEAEKKLTLSDDKSSNIHLLNLPYPLNDS